MDTKKVVLLWVAAIVLMVVIVIYQRTTGPTYPKKGEITVDGSEVKFKLLRSHEVGANAPISIEAPDKSIVAKIKMKRYLSHDEWAEYDMVRQGDNLVSELPEQKPAGKVMYHISAGKDYNNLKDITPEPVVLRYKGVVPTWILYPHIGLMILSFAFAMRVALEAAFKGKSVLTMAYWTLGCFAFGGLVLGPLVQWYAFGAFWTGWPFGKTILHPGDLTDNKTLASILIWVFAIIRIRKHPNQTWWAWIATIVMVIVYLVPHSMFGSEIDFREMQK
jgi:hypothetical protein